MINDLLFPTLLFLNHTMITREQCRAIATVVLGDPEAYEPVFQNEYNLRFIRLQGRVFDLSLQNPTHTVEREVFEVRPLPNSS